MQRQGLKQWFDSGDPWIWLNAAAIATSLCMVLGVILFIAVQGLVYFWPATVSLYEYREPTGERERVMGALTDEEYLPGNRAGVKPWEIEPDSGLARRYLVEIGNREWSTGLEFRWLSKNAVLSETRPVDILVLERVVNGNVYGFPEAIHFSSGDTDSVGKLFSMRELQTLIRQATEVNRAIETIERHQISAVNYRMENVRLERRRLQIDNALDAVAAAKLASEQAGLEREYQQWYQELEKLNPQMAEVAVVVRSAGGDRMVVPVRDIVRAYWPNNMSVWQKLKVYLGRIKAFLTEEPREANTAGGVFPAIFGTVIMVLIMSVMVTPFGVIAAIYLHEYAKQNLFTRLVHISVNNLAGVPSIVYGVFGLGFFVYVLGGNIDRLFYPEMAPSPVFGTGGILWASVTLALLTVPVVIVATEEGLARIPSSLRQGSYALGATRAETMLRVVLPMASPAVMTGVILAIARAAGEVAPLMLVGVVKMAPALPVDGVAPFLHLDRKFMHLGFHIYDVGFQSPNVEAARPLVYATSLLLIGIIIALNLTAIMIRNHLREKYRSLEQ